VGKTADISSVPGLPFADIIFGFLISNVIEQPVLNGGTGCSPKGKKGRSAVKTYITRPASIFLKT
jgi:hypothetical protein